MGGDSTRGPYMKESAVRKDLKPCRIVLRAPRCRVACCNLRASFALSRPGTVALCSLRACIVAMTCGSAVSYKLCDENLEQLQQHTRKEQTAMWTEGREGRAQVRGLCFCTECREFGREGKVGCS
ncbi:hypothetical protein M758_12G170900 [Ceratodon purpureus]|nr:hypothetical protein M758_12G170900 [Ceratodon purpureus]